MDHKDVLLARNRTKRRYQDYRYEAMQSMMRSVTGSASEFAFAVSVMALKAMGKQLPFLTDEDNRKINEIRVCITSKK